MTYDIYPAGSGFKINFAPASVVEEIIQNLATLLATPKFSVPLDRNLGLSARFLDKPMPVAEAMIYAEALEAIEKYEPRAELVNIKFERDDMQGKIIPVLEVKIKDGQ